MSDQPNQDPQVPQVAVKPREKTRPGKPKTLPPFNVVLLDDDEHTFEYVIEMMMKLFGYPPERGLQIAIEVNATKRVIVYTSHKELAEMKQEMIQAYGADPRVSSSAGSMSAVIEPAP